LSLSLKVYKKHTIPETVMLMMDRWVKEKEFFYLLLSSIALRTFHFLPSFLGMKLPAALLLYFDAFEVQNYTCLLHKSSIFQSQQVLTAQSKIYELS